jgi:hypothetical protein
LPCHLEWYEDRVLVDTEWIDENNFEFGTSVVLCHATSHKELYKQATPLLRSIEDAGIFFTSRVRAPIPRLL